MDKYNISCNTCSNKKENGKCKSKLYCIARDNVFFSVYQKLEK